MIIGTEFFNRHVRAIRCMEGILETTRGPVHILGRNKPSVDADDTGVSTLKPQREPKQVNNNADPTRSAIHASQTNTIHQMTQNSVFVRCQLHGLVHTEPKHSVFVIHLLRLTNGIHEIDQ